MFWFQTRNFLNFQRHCLHSITSLHPARLSLCFQNSLLPWYRLVYIIHSYWSSNWHRCGQIMPNSSRGKSMTGSSSFSHSCHCEINCPDGFGLCWVIEGCGSLLYWSIGLIRWQECSLKLERACFSFFTRVENYYQHSFREIMIKCFLSHSGMHNEIKHYYKGQNCTQHHCLTQNFNYLKYFNCISTVIMTVLLQNSNTYWTDKLNSRF